VILLTDALLNRRALVLSTGLLQSWWPTEANVQQSPNPPSWSLSVEVFFYAVFPLIALALARQHVRALVRTLAGVVGAVAILVLSAHLVLSEKTAENVLYHFPPFRLGDFVAGVLLALILKRRAVRLPSLGAVCAATVLAVAALAVIDPWLDRGLAALILLPFWTVLVGSAARADLTRRPSPFRQAWCVKLGVWSYALYLAQAPLVRVSFQIFPHGFSDSLALRLVEYAGLVAVLIAAAAIAHVAVERPLERRLRGTARPSAIQQQDAATALRADAR
jgi:peptidoglycan/LPS O-acetylase OafA/YrhL